MRFVCADLVIYINPIVSDAQPLPELSDFQSGGGTKSKKDNNFGTNTTDNAMSILLQYLLLQFSSVGGQIGVSTHRFEK